MQHNAWTIKCIYLTDKNIYNYYYGKDKMHGQLNA